MLYSDVCICVIRHLSALRVIGTHSGYCRYLIPGGGIRSEVNLNDDHTGTQIWNEAEESLVSIAAQLFEGISNGALFDTSQKIHLSLPSTRRPHASYVYTYT
jgi:hypothetical protein